MPGKKDKDDKIKTKDFFGIPVVINITGRPTQNGILLSEGDGFIVWQDTLNNKQHMTHVSRFDDVVPVTPIT